MDFDDFKVICFFHGIDPEIIETCRKFVIECSDVFELLDIVSRNPTLPTDVDLGYAELADITTKDQSIKKIKDAIFMATKDYDNLGRDITNLRTKQLKKRGSKALSRIVLKSYYLHYFDL